MADRFPVCLAETLKWEGGFSNDRWDPGGATMCGIIQAEYDAFRDRCHQPRQTVKLITKQEFTTIYRDNYWVPSRAGEMPAGVDLLVWDYSVNSGCGQAIKSLQRVLGLSIDGHLGMQTMAAIHNAAPQQLIRSYMDERRRFLRNLKTFWRFGKGWMARCDGVEAAALAAATSLPPAFHALADISAPSENPDEQSAQIGKAPAETSAPPAATEATVAMGGIGTIAAAAPTIVEQSTIGGRWNTWAFLAAVLSQPFFWAGVMTLVGVLMFYLHRRKVAHG